MDYSYKAYDAAGKTFSGVLSAESESEAVNLLRGKGLIPVSMSFGATVPNRGWLQIEIGSSKPRLKERARFARMLETLLRAGVPLDRSLKLISEGGSATRMRSLAAVLLTQVASGSPLSKAMALPAAGFASDECGLVASAERAGFLASALQDLADLLATRIELRARLMAALTYPVVLLVMACLSLAVILSVLVPNLAPLFEQSGAEPPLLVRMVMKIRQFLADHGISVLLALAASTAAVAILFRNPAFREGFKSYWYRQPIARDMEAARICRTLSLQLRNGTAVQSAVQAASSVCKSALTKRQLMNAHIELTAGARLSKALQNVSALRSDALQLVSIGEDSNKLDIMLMHAASALEQQSSQSLERLMTLLTPLLTILLGGLIAGLIVSVMNAILSINSLVVQ